MIRYLFAKDPFSGALEVGRDDKAWLAQIIRKKLYDVVATIKCILMLSLNSF